MERWLCWSGLIVAALFGILFLLDLILKIAGSTFAPFGGMDYVLDVLGTITCSLLVWLSLNALRETK
jgi:hypothetical protein